MRHREEYFAYYLEILFLKKSIDFLNLNKHSQTFPLKLSFSVVP